MGVWESVPCTHTCTHIHMHACTHMHVKHDKHAKHGCLHVGSHLQFLYMYTSMCVCVCACTCMWGHPSCPQMLTDIPPPTCSLPRAAGSPKHQNSISPELIKIIRFCLKILYLWTLLNSYRLNTPTHLPHPPQAKETQIGRITITFEWNKIIEFCLKIWDPWTLLHTYRLHLMCR